LAPAVYDQRMSVLPASVRVAVWATAAYAGRLPLESVALRALPDIDHVEGLTETLTAWRELGEQVVLVGLPRPGDLSSMPRGGPDLVAAAVAAEELVYVPGIGGALVPEVTAYGPDGDQGWQAVWRSHVADPVPVHRVQEVSLGDVELGLRRDLAELTQELAAVGDQPWDGAGLESLARRDLDQDWGMPDGLAPRAERVIRLAGSVLALADVGRDTRLQTVAASTTVQRERVLARLADRGAHALADAANVAAMDLAGWR
jgi:hypothetical protein